MKLFLDTAVFEEIQEAVSWGVIDGITTNPTLLSKEPGDYRENLKKICTMVQGPVSAEVVAKDTDGMLREGRPRSRRTGEAHLRDHRQRLRRGRE